jgi:hypothetical protein
MENNDILVRFHTMNYEERVQETLHQDHYRNAKVTPASEQVDSTLDKAVKVARQAICRIEPFQRTTICEDPDI